MLKVGRKSVAVIASGASIAAGGMIASAVSWWSGAAVAALALLLLILLVVVLHDGRLVARVEKVGRRTHLLERLLTEIKESEERVEKRSLRRHLRIVRGAVAGRLDAMEADLISASRSVVHAADRVASTASALSIDERSIDAALARLDRWAAEAAADDRPRAVANRPQHELVTQIDAMLQLHRRYPMDGPAPLMWGWALSPQALLQVVDFARTGRELVVECGSGTSTIYIGHALREAGRGRLVAIEHLPLFAERMVEYLDQFGLNEIVEVRLAELTPSEVDGETRLWYDPERLEGLEQIDLLLVDGPPSATGPLARLPALAHFAPRLAEDAIVVLDDAQREDEKRILKRWLAHEHLTRELSGTRDQAVLRWSTSHGPFGRAESQDEQP